MQTFYSQESSLKFEFDYMFVKDVPESRKRYYVQFD